MSTPLRITTDTMTSISVMPARFLERRVIVPVSIWRNLASLRGATPALCWLAGLTHGKLRSPPTTAAHPATTHGRHRHAASARPLPPAGAHCRSGAAHPHALPRLGRTLLRLRPRTGAPGGHRPLRRRHGELRAGPPVAHALSAADPHRLRHRHPPASPRPLRRRARRAGWTALGGPRR